MNAKQTKAEFERQLRVLILDSSIEERKRLDKYARPVKLSKNRQNSEPEQIGDILPRVMNDIHRRITPKAENCNV